MVWDKIGKLAPCFLGPFSVRLLPHSPVLHFLMICTGGDGDGAFQAALEGRLAKVPARLRTFLPSLLTFALEQNTPKLFGVRPYRHHSLVPYFSHLGRQEGIGERQGWFH